MEWRCAFFEPVHVTEQRLDSIKHATVVVIGLAGNIALSANAILPHYLCVFDHISPDVYYSPLSRLLA